MPQEESKMSYIDVCSTDNIKVGFKNQINFTEYRYVFKYDISDVNASKIALASNHLDALLDYVHHHPRKHFYEMIPIDVPVREYVDIDFYLDHDATEEEQEEYTERFIGQYLDVRNFISHTTLSNKDIMVMTCHRDNKISLHIISRKTGFKNNQIQNLFQTKVLKEMLESQMDGVIDKCVYSSDRCLRLLGHSKRGSEHPLKVYNPTKYNSFSLLESLIRVEEGDVLYENKYTQEDVGIRQEFRELNDVEEKYVNDFLREYPYFNVRTTTDKLVKLDRIKRGKCLTGAKEHETQDACLFQEKDKIYFKCFCGEGKPMVVGKNEAYYENLVPEKISSVTDVFNGHIEKEAYQRIMSECDTLVDLRQMGCGKTFSAIEYAENQMFLMITHRKSLIEQLIREYDHIQSYKNKNKRKGVPTITCFNSLHKELLRTHFNNFPTIIIDEIGSVMRATDMKDVEESTNALLNIFQGYTGKLILMDANTDDETIQMIHRFNDNRRMRVVKGDLLERDRAHPIQLEMDINEIANSKNILKSKYLVQLLMEDKAVIATNMSIDGKNEELIRFIRHYKPNAKIIHINRDTREETDFSTENLSSYDYIIISPTISEGVSFDDDAFAEYRFYGFFHNNVTDALTTSQMARRFRKITRFYITLAINPYRRRYSTEDEYYQYLQSANKKIDGFLTKQRVFDSETRMHQLKIKRDEFWMIHAKNALHLEHQKSNFVQCFAQACVNNGFRIRKFSEWLYDDEEKEDQLSDLRDAVKQDFYMEVKDAHLLTGTEVSQMDKDVCNHKKTLELTKYRVHNTLRYYKDDFEKWETYHEWDNHVKQTAIWNFRKLFMVQRGANGQMFQLPTKDVLQRISSEFYTHAELKLTFNHQRKWMLRNIIPVLLTCHSLVKALGFENIPSTEPVDMSTHDYHFKQFHSTLNLRKINAIRKTLCQSPLYSKDKLLEDILSEKDICFKWVNGVLKKFLAIKIVKSHHVYMKFAHANFSICDPDMFRILDCFYVENDLSFYHQYDLFFDNINDVYCEFCNRHYKSDVFHTTHLHSKTHIDKVEKGITDWKWKCPCDIGFVRKRTYLDHIKNGKCSVHSADDETCPICEYPLDTDLNTHLDTSHSDIFGIHTQCEICQESILETASEKHHTRCLQKQTQQKQRIPVRLRVACH